jgi:hypothetical protein
MDKISLFQFIIFYFLLVILNILFATGVHPKYLTDKKWKRVLWLISCFVFIPVIVFIVQMPFYVFGEIKKFITGEDKI